jgi:hypothetical protein
LKDFRSRKWPEKKHDIIAGEQNESPETRMP